ncbi:MAG: DUF3638 domain-containing protein [Parachlamydiaceae bacterium]|nr:DUF3638 domain-containing protein [Parachlamydiaceae bacterium]
MNVSEAKALLSTLVQRRQVKRTLESEMTKLFVPKLWGFGVVPFDSLHGRLSLILHRKKQRNQRLNHVKLAFARAVATLQKDAKTFNALFSLDDGLKLIDFAQKHKGLQTLPATSISYPAAEEAPSFASAATDLKRAREAKQKEDELQTAEMREFSLLHRQDKSPAIDLDAFEILFAQKKRPEAFFAALTRFIDAHPNAEYVAKHRHECMELLERGKAINDIIDSHIFPGKAALEPAEHHAALKRVAHQCFLDVLGLNPGKTWTFTGRYGSQAPVLETMKSLLQRIPKEMTKKLPPYVMNALQSGVLPEVIPMIQEALRTGLEQQCEQLPKEAAILNRMFTSALLPDETRSLGRVGALMPKIVREGLESWIQAGFVSAAAEFQNDDTRTALLFTAQIAAKMKKDGVQKSVKKAAGEILDAYVEQPLGTVNDRIFGGLTQFLEGFTELVPRPLLDMAGLSGGLASGHYVLEVVAQSDGDYTLFVYSTGDALQYHPRDAETGKVQWPMRIEDIPGELMASSDFFYRLLTFHSEPRRNPKFVSRAEDIFGETGLLSTLKGKKSKPQAPLREVDVTQTSDMYLRQLMVLNSDQEERAIFEMQLEGLLGLCRQFVNQETQLLTMPDQATCDSVDEALSKLQESYNEVKGKLALSSHEPIEATFTEVRLAIEAFRKQKKQESFIGQMTIQTSQAPASIAEKFAQMLAEKGVSTDVLIEHKETLCWALGSEFEEFLETISDAAQVQPRVAPKPKSTEKPGTLTPTVAPKSVLGSLVVTSKRGWLGTLVMNAYVQIALSLFQLVLLLTDVWKFGFKILFNPALRWAVRCVTPAFIQRWYVAFMGEVQRFLAEVTFNILLKLLCNPEDATALKAMMGTWRTSVHEWTKALTGKQELQLGLDKAPVCESTYFANRSHYTLGWGAHQNKLETDMIGASIDTHIGVPSVTDRIAPHKIVDMLQMWVEQAEELDKDERARKTIEISVVAHVVCAQVKCLFEQGDKFWDEVADPKQCLDSLIKLSICLNDSGLHASKIGAVVVANYSLVAIMDRLARRDQGSGLDGFSINISHLLQWMQRIPILQDPILEEHLRRICHYFVPQFDLNNPPDHAELLKYAKNCLFDYSDFDRGSISLNSLIHDLPKEFIYLKRCLQDPEVYKKLMQRKVLKKGSGNLEETTDSQKLHHFQLLGMLFDECLFLTHKDPVINRSYALLRFQVLLSQRFVERTRNQPDTATIAKADKGETEKNSLFGRILDPCLSVGDFHDLAAPTLPEMVLNVVTLNGGKQEMQEIGERLFKRHQTKAKFFLHEFFISNFTHYHKEKYQDPTQAKLIELEANYSSSVRMHHVKRGSIFSEKTDDIIHALVFFKKHPKEFHAHISSFTLSVLRPLALQRHLKVPQFGQAVAEFFGDLLAANEQTPWMFCYAVRFGLIVKRYCERYCREMPIFPDFKEQVRKVIRAEKDTNWHADFRVLYALTFDQEPTQQEGQLEAAIAICQAVFSYNAHGVSTKREFGSVTYPSFNKDIGGELRTKYLQWLPTIFALLQDVRMRTAIAKGILSLFNVPCPSNVEWVDVPEGLGWEFTYNSMVLNFKDGVLDTWTPLREIGNPRIYEKMSVNSKKTVTTRNLRNLKEQLEHARLNADNPEQVEVAGLNHYRTADRSYSAHFIPNQPITFKRIVDGKTYVMLTPTWPKGIPPGLKELTPACTKRGDLNVPWDVNHMKFWIEETSATDKEMLCYREFDKALIYRFSVREAQDGALTIKQSSSHMSLDSAVVKKVHSSLYRFCPESDIRCFAQEHGTQIKEIVLVSSGLTFHVERQDEHLRAYSTRFAGYYLVPQQGNTHLHYYASYLLLTNRLGEFKVVLPANEWLPTAAWQFLNGFGVFGSMINNAFMKQESTEFGKLSFFAYDMDPQTGYLTSDDPVALSYLLSLNLVQQNAQAADRACTQLELLCARTYVPQDILKQLYPLFIPGAIQGIAVIRQRILAALEQNRVIHGQEKQKKTKKAESQGPKKEPEKEEFPFFELLSLLNLFIDCTARIRNPEAHQQITEYQEWYLYKRLIYCTKRLLKSQNQEDLPEAIKLLKDDSQIEYLIFSVGPLKIRYETLKKKFGKVSLAQRFVNFSAKAIEAQATTLPGFSLHVTTPVSVHTGFDREAEFASTIQVLGKHYLYDMRSMPNLIKEMKEFEKNGIEKEPPLTVETVSKDSIKRHFRSYCLIAIGEEVSKQLMSLGKEKKHRQLIQLRNLLPYIQGGWDEESRLLVRWLQAIEQFPFLFWNAKPMRAASTKELLEHVNGIFMARHALGTLGSVLGQGILDCEVRSSMISSTPLLSFFPVTPGMLSPLLYWGSKAVRAYMKRDSIAAATVAIPTVSTAESFAALESVDQEANRVLDSFFDIAFQEVRREQEQNQVVAAFTTVTDSAAEKERVARLNASIEDYYARDRSQVFLRLKSSERLSVLYVEMTLTHSQLEQRLKEERQQILQAVNGCLPEGSRAVSFEDLLLFFLRGNLKHCPALAKLPLILFQQLDMRLARYLVYYTRFQQLGRALGHLKNVSQAVNRSSREQCLEQLADELKGRRNYSLTETPLHILRRLMIFEFKTDKMLWKKQISAVVQMTEDSIVELLMSLGKTYFFIPAVTSILAADERNIVFNIWPASMFGTNVRQGSAQSHHVFGQMVHALSFNRDVVPTVARFQAISLLLRRAREEQHPIHMRSTEAMALRLLFIDQLYQASQESSEKNLFEREEVILEMASVLRAMRFEGGIAIGDEAHELFNNIQELCFPIGSPSQIPLPIYQAVEACMRHVAAHKKLLELIRSNSVLGIDKIYEKEIIPYLAEKMSGYWKFGITAEKKAEFIAFVTGKATVIPDWILNHKHYAEISIVKGVITVLLPMVFKRVVNVNFGASKQKDVLVAKPYNGNDNVREQSSISDPVEALIKTMVMLLHNPLNSFEPIKIVAVLLRKARQEANVRHIPIEETRAQKLFEEITGTKIVLSRFDDEPLEVKLRLLTDMWIHPAAIFLYTRNFVWKEVKYYKDSLRCDALNFAAMFHKQIHDTGTPFNDGSYPDHLRMLWDRGTAGEALHLMKKKCPADGMHILTEKEPKKILKEVLSSHFGRGSKFRALIDGGAQLRGLSNEQVATEMLEYAVSDNSHIQAVDFFMQNPAETESGKDKKDVPEILMTMMMINGVRQIVPADQCTLPLSARWAYFDQVHGYAANIPLEYDAAALCLVGEQHMLYRLLQEIFRMRGIKFFKRLLEGNLTQQELDQVNLNERQTIHFAMTREIADLISKGNIPTLEEFVAFTARNEAQEIAKDNYAGYRKKVNNLVQQAVLDKILKETRASKMIEFFRKGIGILVAIYQDDPRKVYGLLDVMIPTEQALEACRSKAVAQLESTGIFSQREMERHKKELAGIKKPPMPEQIHAYSDGKQVHTDRLDQLNLSQEQELASEEEQEQEQEQELETYKQTNVATSGGGKFEEWGWEGALRVRSTEWLKFTDTSPLNLSFLSRAMAKVRQQFDKLKRIAEMLRLKKKNAGAPPLFRVTDLLKHACNKLLRTVADAFDTRIYVTNNFLPRVTSRLGESSVEIGSFGQRELQHVLIHFEERDGDINILSMGCLSMKDAVVLRKQIEEEQKTKRTSDTVKKVMLYNPVLRVRVAGDEVDRKVLLSNPDLLKLEAQVKWLNGDVQFPKEQATGLAEWMEKAGAERLEPAFESIQDARGDILLPMAGSDYEMILSKIKKIPVEEQLF